MDVSDTKIIFELYLTITGMGNSRLELSVDQFKIQLIAALFWEIVSGQDLVITDDSQMDDDIKPGDIRQRLSSASREMNFPTAVQISTDCPGTAALYNPARFLA